MSKIEFNFSTTRQPTDGQTDWRRDRRNYRVASLLTRVEKGNK